MKLQLIGTGSITAPQTSASALIDDKILIDCGSGVIKQLMKQNIDIFDIDTILISHLHGDHFFDLVYIILLRSFNSVENDLIIYGPSNLKQSVIALFKIGYSDLEDIEKIFADGRSTIVEFTSLDKKVDEHHLKSLLVEHGKTKPSFGFIVQKDNKKIGFSGDSCYCKAIDYLIENTDVAVIECSLPKNSEDHMGPEIIEKLAKKGEIIVTHMSLLTREILEKKQLENVTIGNDGDIFNI